MTLHDLPPEVQRLIFLAAEIIREDPRSTTEQLISVYEVGVGRGKMLGMEEAVKIVETRKGIPL